MLQNVAGECGQNVVFKFFHLKNKRKGIFEFLFGMLFTVLTATFSCLLLSPRINRSVCKIISKHYIVPTFPIPEPRLARPPRGEYIYIKTEIFP